MQAFLSMAASRAVDDYAIQTCKIPGEQLMLNAGNALVDTLISQDLLKGDPQTVILAGHGNNGGDGFVIAAGLYQKGIPVSVILARAESLIQGDALHHYKTIQSLDVPISTWDNSSVQCQQIEEADLLVDALLGTGIKGSIRSPYDALIDRVNASRGKVVAVDVPSGVTGDLGQILSPCVQSDLTVSMGYGKQGCLFEPARTKSAHIVPVEIGFPSDSLDQVEDQILYRNSAQTYSPLNFTRAGAEHKYTTGKVFIIAGSKGFTGAALLASKAALRAGAGLVRLAIPASLGTIAESQSLETVVDYVADTGDGHLARAAWPDLQLGCEWADTVVIGPGLGRHLETMDIAKKVIEECSGPLVVDADALFAINADLTSLEKRQSPTILTPHQGEFKRLFNSEAPHTLGWLEAQKFAIDHGVHLLLKGAPSLLANPSGHITVNSSGYAGMATAGSGDVLSGVLAALWAQWNHTEVLSFAMYIHGYAADLNRSEKGVLGLIAGDIVEALPRALKEYGGLPV